MWLIAGASMFKNYIYVILGAYGQAARGSAVLPSSDGKPGVTDPPRVLAHATGRVSDRSGRPAGDDPHRATDEGAAGTTGSGACRHRIPLARPRRRRG